MSRLLLITEPGLLEAFRLKYPERRPREDLGHFTGVLMPQQYGIRVIESRFLARTTDADYPPKILGDFDRWFRSTLNRIEMEKSFARERQQRRFEEAFDGAWRL